MGVYAAPGGCRSCLADGWYEWSRHEPALFISSSSADEMARLVPTRSRPFSSYCGQLLERNLFPQHDGCRFIGQVGLTLLLYLPREEMVGLKRGDGVFLHNTIAFVKKFTPAFS